MTAHTQDDAFHEIQLNGKQLVFLFMAATVVSVVIFLCGVLVGRGVRAERGGMVADTAIGTAPDPPAHQAVAPPSADADPTTAAPPPAADDLSYFNRLEKTSPPPEELRPASGLESNRAAVAPDKAPDKTPVKAPPPEKNAEKPATKNAAAKPPAAQEEAPAASSAPSGTGYAVQVAALNVKGEADAIARRLSSKGYSAYVLDPANGTPQVFRVRVGKFPSKREADTVAAKLQKEEQFKPWVTR